MRIAIVAPWFRTLAHLYGHKLSNSGHHVLIGTADRHFQDGYGLCEEVSARVQGRGAATSSREIARVRRAIQQFRPDVVVEDSITDPRWLKVASPSSRWMMIHDPAPHDDRHRKQGVRRATVALQLHLATGVIAFSEASQRVLQRRLAKPVVFTPLLSEMEDRLITPVGRQRNGFVCMGRISAYKGFDIAIAAWRGLPDSMRRQHPLRVFASSGDPRILSELKEQDDIEFEYGRFDFRDVSPHLSRSIAMVVPYRAGSQSGVQLLGMQHGMVPLISALPGMTEYQPAEFPPVEVLKPATWTRTMGSTVKAWTPDTSALVRAHYETVTSDFRLAEAWSHVLDTQS